MKYKVYYKNDICNPFNKGSKCLWEMGKSRHIWPEDNTELSLYLEDGYMLYYEITNLSDRTQYLYDNNLLGLGVFIEENESWISKKWRSTGTKERHIERRCMQVYSIDSLSGSIDLYSMSNYGALSRQLYHLFDISGQYEDPFVSSGEEYISIGIGRYCDFSCGFRPYKVSDYAETQVENLYNY